MAIKKIDSTGTKVNVSGDGGITFETIGCLQSLGSLEETRPVQSYSCLSSNDSTKSLGSIERGTLNLQALLDTDSVTNAGQEVLRTAFYANTDVTVQIELTDMPSGGTNGTTYEFEGGVSRLATTIEKDAAVLVDFDTEITSDITVTPAA
jgi:hypothetical protein